MKELAHNPNVMSSESWMVGGFDTRSPFKVVILADASESMWSVEEQTRKAIQQYTQGLARDPKLKFEVTYGQFSDTLGYVARNVPVEAFEPKYEVNGGTALWDSLTTLMELESERKVPVICVIITDGEDNLSKKYDQRTVFRIVTQRRDVWKNWTFVWIGMEGSAQQAKEVGIDQFLDISREDLPRELQRLSVETKRLGEQLRVSGKKQGQLLLTGK